MLVDQQKIDEFTCPISARTAVDGFEKLSVIGCVAHMTVSRLIGVAPEAKGYQIGPGVVEFLSVPMVHM